MFGPLILGNFLDRICGNPGLWRMDAFIDRAVGDDPGDRGPAGRVVCGLSAGSIRRSARALLARALGPRVVCVFVDNGLLEGANGRRSPRQFGEHSAAELRVVDAADRVLSALEGITDPRRTDPDRPHLHRRVPRRGPVDRRAKFLAQGTCNPT